MTDPTAGERAYIEDCRRKPNYHTGEKRHAWAALCAVTRWSWERNPTAREYANANANP